MSFVEENLIPGEHVLYVTGLHWIVIVSPVVVSLLLVVASMAIFTIVEPGTLVLGLVPLSCAGVVFLFGYLQRRATEIAVTNKRILIKTGILTRKTLEILLSKVESIRVEEGMWGRMFGYGAVIIRGTGGTPEPFRNIAQPLEFRRLVHQQIEQTEQKVLS